MVLRLASVERARRFLTLVKQPENAEIIRAELRELDGKYGDYLESSQGPPMPPNPSAYLGFLLAVSWNIDLQDPEVAYTSGGDYRRNLLDVNGDPHEIDNNDGITVLDITNPDHPAYCFVSIGGLEGAEEPPEDVPLTAEQYGRAYYPEPDPDKLQDERAVATEEMIQSAIANLEGEELVTRSMLAEAWPDDFENPKSEEEDEDDASNDEEDMEAAINATDGTEEHQKPFPSLVEMTLKPVVLRAVESGDTQGVEELLWLPGKAPLVKSILLDMEPFPASGIPLFLKALAGCDDDMLDLSTRPFSSAHLVEIVSACKNLEWLNVSYNPNVTSDTVRQILAAAPGLRRLVLLQCPSLDEDELCVLVRTEPGLFKSLDAMIHPMFIEPHDPDKLPNTFTFLIKYTHLSSREHPFLWGSTMATATPTRIVQCLIDFFGPIAENDMPEYIMDETGIYHAAFTSTRKPGRSWGERSIVAIPQISRRGFFGEGWVFFMITNLYDYSAPIKHQWAFVRWVLPSSSQENPSQQKTSERAGDNASEGESKQPVEVPTTSAETQRKFVPEVHDLLSFLHVMYEEGRPHAPEDAVAKLESMLKKLKRAAMLKATDI